MRQKNLWHIALILLVFLSGCDLFSGDEDAVPMATLPRATATPRDVAPLSAASDAGGDTWALWDTAGSGPRLRGADVHPCRVFDDDAGTCVELLALEDLRDLRDLGANLLNASYPGVFTETPPYEVHEASLRYLDDLVAWAEEVGLYVVIHFRTGPGRNEAAIHEHEDALYDVWYDQAAHDAWVAMWRFTAERYRASPVVVGYDLMVEPHPNTLEDFGEDVWEPEDVQAAMAGTLLDWNALAAEITAGIREVDPATPIIISSIHWASPAWLPALEPTGDPRTIYSLHAYTPHEYTHQEPGRRALAYPDEMREGGETIVFDRAWLEETYAPGLDFAQEHGVPIYVGEFGVMRWVPGAAEFARDLTELFEAYGWSYAVYGWRTDELYWDGLSLEYGPDPEHHAPVPDNALLAVHRERWSRNVDFPGAASQDVIAPVTPSPAAAAHPLDAVRHWLYCIDVNLAPETVEQITASAHDMVVLDFIPSEANNTDYPMAGVVAQLHEAAHPKLALAYIDIGEAESYRTYWQPGWEIGDPAWIAGGDPDGWDENYPVAYWDDAWREIWLAEDGYLAAIIAAGFDGVYLDWVEAYSDENVMAVAEDESVDARQAMVRWVSDIAAFGRARRPGFLVIAQNAAELAAQEHAGLATYLDAIDAVAQEQVWFDGGADNDPPGDCPLPRTEADVDTDAYYDSLPRPCQRQYDEFPESTLHVSSEGYIQDLQAAQRRGVRIFTVDYALEPGNIAWVYATSRALGFVPFVSNRALDRYVAPVE